MDGFMILGIVLLAAGFLFVGIETIIPGFGAPGILGGCCLVAGVFLIADSVQEAVIIVAVVLLLLAVLIFTLVTLLAKGRLKTPIILNDKMNKEEGYISSTDLQYLVGKKGVGRDNRRVRYSTPPSFRIFQNTGTIYLQCQREREDLYSV